MDYDEKYECSFCSNRNSSGQQCKGVGSSGTKYTEVLELLRPELCFPCQCLLDTLRQTAAFGADGALGTKPSQSSATVECELCERLVEP